MCGLVGKEQAVAKSTKATKAKSGKSAKGAGTAKRASAVPDPVSSRMAEGKASSNLARDAGGIRSRSRNCRTTGRIR